MLSQKSVDLPVEIRYYNTDEICPVDSDMKTGQQECDEGAKTL